MSTDTTTAPTKTPVPTDRGHGPSSRIYLAFVPWVLFSLVAQRDTLAAAAVVALAASIAISLPSLAAGAPKLLELATIVTFVAFTVVALVTEPALHDWLTRYARAIATALLALIAFGSLLWVPFTEQYARESVPRELWSSPRFRQINRQLTTLWGCVFIAMVPSHLLAGAIDTHRADTIFNWIVPVALIVWAAKRTEAVTTAANN